MTGRPDEPPGGETGAVDSDLEGESALDVQIDASRSAEDILRAIRRILQSITIHSKKLYRQAGLTVPQMLCLRAIGGADHDEVTAAEVARQVQLSPATVTGILDRLERYGLIVRERRSKDRRKICLSLTPEGTERMESLDPSLQDRFLVRLMSLEESDRQDILRTLGRLGEMIEGSSIDAAPILVMGDVKNPTPKP